MSDLIIGHDGRPRCAWAGTNDTALVRYHDKVWGTRTGDESALFEALTLGVFQAGLSWEIVFGETGRVSEAVSRLRRRRGRKNDFAGRGERFKVGQGLPYSTTHRQSNACLEALSCCSA